MNELMNEKNLKMAHYGNDNGFFGRHHTNESKKKISENRKGKLLGNTQGFKKGQKAWNKGKSNYWAIGDKNVNWNGGISTENEKIRHSIEYKLWEDAVFARDNFTCQKCKQTMLPYKFVSHHILNFATHIDIRLAIDNGITFCRNCHKIFHKKYGFKNNTKEQVNEFLTTPNFLNLSLS